MSTKIKGDKIKEGSIPLKSLNEETKNTLGVANFLNNNNTPGGIINMPFGYEGVPTQVYNSVILANSDNDAGEISGFYYNQLVVSYESHNIINATRTVKINSIRGEENKVNLYGIISIYVDNSNHLHIVNEAHFDTSAIIYFKAFYSYKKLPLEFTTPYIVGNDTQEQLDELYSKLINELDFTSNVYIVDGKGHRIVGLGIFKHTYGDNWIINIITTNNINGFLKYIIGGANGQNLKELITLENTDNSLIIEESNLVPTPNWNAQEDEAGYIKNRTHFIDPIAFGEEMITKVNNNVYEIDLSRCIIILDSGLYYPAYDENYEPNCDAKYLFGSYRYIDCTKYTVCDLAVDDGATFYGYIKLDWSDRNRLRISSNDDNSQQLIEQFTSNVRYIGEYDITTLSELFIPTTFLKTTPQTLSTADKNQALTNLGIDPVVWKYLCNPIIIHHGEKVPENILEDILTGEFDDTGYDYDFSYYKLKDFVCAAMFKYVNDDDINFTHIYNTRNATYGGVSVDIDSMFYVDSEKKWHRYDA